MPCYATISNCCGSPEVLEVRSICRDFFHTLVHLHIQLKIKESDSKDLQKNQNSGISWRGSDRIVGSSWKYILRSYNQWCYKSSACH